MEDLIRIIESKLKKHKSSHSKSWIYYINLKNCCIQSKDCNLLSATIFGKGNIHDIIEIEINYELHGHIDKIYKRYKKCRGIQTAILYIWNFPKKYTICPECCELVKSDQMCQSCIFFKSYMKYNNQHEICGICQEETYRTVLPCNHYFHKACIIKMDPENLKCPLCRHPVHDTIILDLFEQYDHDDSDNDVSFNNDDDSTDF